MKFINTIYNNVLAILEWSSFDAAKTHQQVS